MYFNKFTIFKYDFEYSFMSVLHHMNVYRFMLIRIEQEDKSEVFKYLWHSNLLILTYLASKDRLLF